MENKAYFSQHLKMLLARAGYGEVILPTEFTYDKSAISLFGKQAGSMAYFYALYNLAAISPQDLALAKADFDKIVNTLTSRNKLRHAVVFHIQIGITDENQREIERLNGVGEDFGFNTLNHIYYGIDLANSRILSNTKQLPNLDGARDKVQAALAAAHSDVFHVEHFGIKQTTQAAPLSKHSVFSYIIISINILLFVLMELSGGSTDILTLKNFGAVTHHHIFTLGEYHRLVIPIFLHIGVMHLLFNTMSLILFGIRAERFFGIWKFLVIYIISGIAGNVAMALTSVYAVGAGASGSIYGVIGALFALTKVRRKNVENLNSSSLAIMIVIGIVMGFTMAAAPDAPNVANSAHIGGLVTGFALGWLLTIEPKKKREKSE